MASIGDNVTAAGRPSRRKLANAVRALAMDAVERAQSGHPGMPMGMADIAEVLWNDYLRFNPGNPRWFDRDRFVLSNGHGSMLLYAVASLTGYAVDIGELEKFRQLGSRTPGHPERDLDLGVETTTGPLGQGLGNAVGMAIAERALAAAFNRPGLTIVDHHTYAFCGDGCLMEGVSHEVCSLAGTLGLGKLIVFYDNNGISIDGRTAGWFTDDTPERFRAYGWHVVPNVDGHEAAAVARAIDAARAETDRPSLICCKTIIGWGAPGKQGTAATHGAALGADEVAAARKALEWPYAPFEIPDDVLAGWDARERGRKLEAEWDERFARYRIQSPELASEFLRRMHGQLPAGWDARADGVVAEVAAEAKPLATRLASLRALEAFAPLLPELIGGSADLTGSNNTLHSHSVTIGPAPDVGGPRAADPGAAGAAGVAPAGAGGVAPGGGNYIHYGVREFGMAAIMNGLAVHGALIPYGGTFLVFSDYARNALRLAALMKARSIFVLTHDSIGLGEDGPTHQPVEHLASLRAMPNMRVWRPCDSVETVAAWRDALERRDGPTILALTRQSLPFIERSAEQIEAIRRGGYILRSGAEAPQLVLVATGSEVALALEAAGRLEKLGASVRVVSMPCTELFEAQPAEYRGHVLPADAAKLAIEAGVAQGWWRYVAGRGDVIGLDRFGESAKATDLFRRFGFTVEHIVETARRFL